MGPVDNIPALVQIMAWRRPGDKPLSEPMMVGLLTHICVTRPQWVKKISSVSIYKSRVWCPSDMTYQRTFSEGYCRAQRRLSLGSFVRPAWFGILLYSPQYLMDHVYIWLVYGSSLITVLQITLFKGSHILGTAICLSTSMNRIDYGDFALISQDHRCTCWLVLGHISLLHSPQYLILYVLSFFMSILYINITQVIGILPRQRLVYFT